MFPIKFYSILSYLFILSSCNVILNNNYNYGAVNTKLQRNCKNRKCNEIPKHYEEMGCTAVYSAEYGDDCCPTRFDCRQFSLNTNVCHYKGNTYKSGERILNTNDCFADCRCGSSYRIPNGTEIRCANIHCPDAFDDNLGKCIQLYENLTSCCAKNYVCDENEIFNMEKCYFNGDEYRIGEIIYPANTCYKCLCEIGFNNLTAISDENPNCQRIDCGMTLHSDEELKMGCIPIYWNDITCCPISWKCPSPNDKIVKSNERGDVLIIDDKNRQCKFGENTLNIGDKILNADKCLLCTCETPPMAHCIKQSNC